MASGASNAQLFCDLLDEKEIKYQTNDLQDGDVLVQMSWNAENAPTIEIYVILDGDGESCAIRALPQVRVPENKLEGVWSLANSLNARFRWARFYTDSDNDVVLQCDAVLTETTAADVCFELSLRLLNIADEAYPDMMKQLWA
ncbi:YbjN domain-containing protein [Adlercreutzia aquisgranensis]|nr:YbjN domain-containing protein [Adlercreutzia aquisgranensis]